MKVENNNMNLWKNILEAKTPEEKKNVLKENIKYTSINYNIDVINNFSNYDDEDDEKQLIDDSRISKKILELKKIIKKLKAKALAERLARGQQLTKKEIKYLKKNAPELIVKAKIADHQRKILESKVKSAQTSKEAENILFLAQGLNAGISRSAGSEDGKDFSDLLNEAYKKAERNTRLEIRKKERKDENKKRHIDKHV